MLPSSKRFPTTGFSVSLCPDSEDKTTGILSFKGMVWIQAQRVRFFRDTIMACIFIYIK